tara:strand:- start:335 stop:613 length:279 start_codon:yes stop_codon:yes gene_type:complete
MKNLVLAMFVLAPSLAFAQIPVGILLPVVGIQSDGIVTLKDKQGQRYFVQTDCDVKTDEVEEFTVRDRKIKEGTRIKFSKEKTCRVEFIEAV